MVLNKYFVNQGAHFINGSKFLSVVPGTHNSVQYKKKGKYDLRIKLHEAKTLCVTLGFCGDISRFACDCITTSHVKYYV